MTTRKPRGKMTKALVTPYSVGDRIEVIATVDGIGGVPLCSAGETGTIRQIVVAGNGDDGDDSFLMFNVRFDKDRRMELLGDIEFAPSGAEAWLRRQLGTLNSDRNGGAK